MAGTNTDSVIWVAGESAGYNGSGGTTTQIPNSAIFRATSTTVPTALADGRGKLVYVASNDKMYVWVGSAWVGAYATS